MRTLRGLLNEFRWSPATESHGVVIEVRTREAGAEEVAEVDFESVLEILPRGVTLVGGTFLPYHRFVRVRRGAEVLWPVREGAWR